MKKVAATLFFLLAGTSFYSWADQAEAPVPYKQKIAIVDSRDLAPRPDKKSRYLSHIYSLGTAEMLAIDLKRVEGFIVLDRERVLEKLKGLPPRKSLEEAGQLLGIDLGADLVAQLQFRFLDKNYIEIALVCMETRSKKTTTLKVLQGPEKDLFEMLERFVIALAEFEGHPLSKEAVRRLEKQAKVSMEAWHRFTRGMEFYYQKNQSSLILAHEQLHRAELRDILFLPTYIAQAKVYLYEAKQKWGPEKTLYENSIECARKALFIDGQYLDGYEIIAEAQYLRGNYIDSVRECLKAIRLNPLSLRSRYFLVKSYLALGKKEEADREINKMLEIDPTYEEARKLRSAPAVAPAKT